MMKLIRMFACAPVLLLAGLVLGAFTVFAEGEESSVVNWVGLSDARWGTPENWSGGAVPFPGNAVAVGATDAAGTPFPNLLKTIDAAVTQTVWSLTFDRGAAVTLDGAEFKVTDALTVTNASFTVTGDVALNAGRIVIPHGGSLVVSGGIVTNFAEIVVQTGGLFAVEADATVLTGALVLEPGARAALDGGTVSVASYFSLTNGAQLAMNAETNTATLVLGGDAYFYEPEAFSCGLGTVTIAGEGTNTVDFGYATNASVHVERTGEGVVYFPHGFAASDFVCDNTNVVVTLAFGADEYFRFQNILVNAQSNNTPLATLCSTVSGVCWRVEVEDFQGFSGVRVADSDASPGRMLETCKPSVQIGTCCTNWDFNVRYAFWTGAAGDSKFTTANNWSNRLVPDEHTRCFVTNGALSLTLPTRQKLRALTLNGGITLTLAGAATIGDTLDITGGDSTQTKIVFNSTERMAITRDLIVRNRATITHSQINAQTMWKYRVSIDVGRDVTVEPGGSISAAAKVSARSSFDGSDHGSYNHAGIIWPGERAVGCIYAPTNCGQAPFLDGACYAGGAVQVFCNRKMTVNGSIDAWGGYGPINNDAGSGGSVWLKCGWLLGSGRIHANAQSPQHWPTCAGSGGRVAIWFSENHPTNEWRGLITAYGGKTGYSEREATPQPGRQPGPCGTVFFQWKGGDVRNSSLYLENVDTGGNGVRDASSIFATELSRNVGAQELGSVYIGRNANVYIPEGETIKIHGDWKCATSWQPGTGAGHYQISGLMTNWNNCVEFAGTNTSAISGYTTFRRFACRQPGKELVFEANATNVMSVLTRFELRGSEDEVVRLSSSRPGRYWRFEVGRSVSRNCYFVGVNNSQNTLADTAGDIIAHYSWGNATIGWRFPEEDKLVPQDMHWTGVFSTQWQDERNWLEAREPTFLDTLYVPGEVHTVLRPHMPLLDINVTDQYLYRLRVIDSADVTMKGTAFYLDDVLAVRSAKLTVASNAPAEADRVVIDGADGGGTLVIDGNTLTAHSSLSIINGGLLVVTNYGSLVVKDMWLGKGSRIWFHSGTIKVSGQMLVDTGSKIDVYRGVFDFCDGNTVVLPEPGMFSAGIGEIRLSGPEPQTLSLASNSFNIVTIDKPYGGDITFTDGFQAKEFMCRSIISPNNQNIFFGAGEYFDFRQCCIYGVDANMPRIYLRSTQAGVPWRLKVFGHTVMGVTASDSDASDGEEVATSSPSVNAGGNTNWQFGSKITNWKAEGSGKWNDAANWSVGVPDATMIARIYTFQEGSVIDIPDNAAAKLLAVGKIGKKVTINQLGKLTVGVAVDIDSKTIWVAKSKKAVTCGGDIIIREGATITHDANLNKEQYSINFVAGGNLRLDEGATIDVTSKGYGKGNGVTTPYGTYYGVHGGGNRFNTYAYDSMFCPVRSGGVTGGENIFGGGVVYLEAGEHMTIDGRILSCGTSGGNYDSGAGGSIWLKAYSYSGFGSLDVSGGSSAHSGASGGGGRISVMLTDPHGSFTNWTGTAMARYGWPNGVHYYNWGACGTVWFGNSDRWGDLYLGAELPAAYKPPAAERPEVYLYYVGHSTRLPEDYAITKWTPLPMAEDGGDIGYRRTDITLVHHGQIYLTSDITVHDLDMKEEDQNYYWTKYEDKTRIWYQDDGDHRQIRLNGHKLKIRSWKHLNGRGWYDGWESRVTFSDGGDIIWLPRPASVRLR